MRTVIFKTITPYLCALMVVYSIFVLLRGHNEPGGGFIGGLIAASAVALYGISAGVVAVRKALYFNPLGLAGFGVLLALGSGLVAVLSGGSFLKGLWWTVNLPFKESMTLSTPLFFDIGVWLAVVGTISSLALALEENE